VSPRESAKNYLFSRRACRQTRQWLKTTMADLLLRIGQKDRGVADAEKRGGYE
jgi:hypothetical protein